MTKQTKTFKLLLVDDEAEFALTLAERLELRGFGCTVCPSGETALEKARYEHFDLVLLDVMLPGQNGLVVMRRLQELKPKLPIMLLTGNSNARDGIEGMKQGARAYLTKPVELQSLLELVAEVQKEASHE